MAPPPLPLPLLPRMLHLVLRRHVFQSGAIYEGEWMGLGPRALGAAGGRGRGAESKATNQAEHSKSVGWMGQRSLLLGAQVGTV